VIKKGKNKSKYTKITVLSIEVYTVTRPYEGFRHPDWMVPESTVRGRENDFLVRPGYIHSQIPNFSGGYGIFRRFSL
jgi:hypothetical protein